MNLAIIVSLLVAGCCVAQAAKWPEKDGRPCTCTRLHDPVCGSDGQDYPNKQCAKNCGKVRSFTRGTCDRPALCGCPYNIATVCARRPDGTLDEFDNICLAGCQNGAEFVSDGPCPAKPVQPLPGEQLRELRSLGKERVKKNQACACTAIYSPVCGLKHRIWRDYASQCVADCAGVESTKPGTCRPKRGSCLCRRIYKPVCARKPDGTLKDYSNDCLAECEEAVTVSSGRCVAKPDNSLPSLVKKSSETVCACPFIHFPVCAEIHGARRVYPNKCTSVCANATYIHDGSCEEPDLTTVYPVRYPVHLPVDHSDTDDSDITPVHLPWTPNDSDDADDKEASLLPWTPNDSDDADDQEAVQLPWTPDDADDQEAVQLPWTPNDSDDADDVEAAQLPWLDDNSADSDESDLEALQLPSFPSLLFKRRAQH